MADEEKRAEDMEKFYSLLMEVKVVQAETNGKLDTIIDMKSKLEETHRIAYETSYKANQNEEDIGSMSKALKEKASKEDVGKIVKQRETLSKNIPAWIAIAISAITALVGIFTYLE